MPLHPDNTTYATIDLMDIDDDDVPSRLVQELVLFEQNCEKYVPDRLIIKTVLDPRGENRSVYVVCLLRSCSFHVPTDVPLTV